MLKFRNITVLFILALWFMVGGSVMYGYSHLVGSFIFATIVYSLIVTWGVTRIHSQMFVPTINSNKHAKDKIAITFDDGPDESNTEKILDLLKEYDAKASFFIIGNKIAKNKTIVERIHAEGHLIGNHSFSHKNTFSIMNSKKITKEISDAKQAIEEITGKECIYFRPPFGITNPLIAKALQRFKLKTIGWSIRTLDTLNAPSKDVVNRIAKRVRSGEIILVHDTSDEILDIVKRLLDLAKERHLKVVTVEELMK